MVDRNRIDHNEFAVDSEKIEVVEEIVYLGSTITNKGSSGLEIRRRLALARSTTQNMV